MNKQINADKNINNWDPDEKNQVYLWDWYMSVCKGLLGPGGGESLLLWMPVKL